jgi:hypothetical protein
MLPRKQQSLGGLNEMKIVAGLVLLALGVSLFILSFVIATRTDTVIDISFVLEPSEKRGPGENGIYHHTRVISRSALMGEVLVQGGAINFTASGFNTQHLENIFIGQNYSFAIDPADDLYSFTFENTGSIQSSIRFTLKEKWINIFLLIPGFITLLIFTSIGIALSILGICEKPTQTQSSRKVYL